MDQRPPGARSDHGHNEVALSTSRRGIPERERVLVRDEEEMAASVEKAATIDPARCRQTAAERFAPDRVAAGYEDVYRETLVAHGDGRRVSHPAGVPA